MEIKLKVVLVGESKTGKTSIISRYISNTFSSVLTSTPGASFNTNSVQIENQNIKFEICDTAGQEKYRALAKVFYKNSPAIILVYDITSRVTFEELKRYWIPEVKENGMPNASKFLIIYKNYKCLFC